MKTVTNIFETIDTSKICTQWNNMKDKINRNSIFCNKTEKKMTKMSEDKPMLPIKDLSLLTLERQYSKSRQKSQEKFFAMEWASECGHIDLVKFLYPDSSEETNFRALELAAKNGHREIVKFLGGGLA
jgi:hypothetical protein